MSERVVRGLFGPEVLVAVMDPADADPSALLPAERDAVARAVDKRRREYTAGRVLARRLLEQLGVADFPVLSGDRGAPVWPDRVCGSISHTRSVAAVALSPVTEDTVSLGLDIESDAPLRDALWHIVFTEAERRWLTSTADAKVVFSAKEALYKAQYPITGKFLGFDAVDVELDADRFAATFRGAVGPIAAGTRWTGRFGRGGGIVATALQVQRTTSGYVTS